MRCVILWTACWAGCACFVNAVVAGRLVSCVAAVHPAPLLCAMCHCHVTAELECCFWQGGQSLGELTQKEQALATCHCTQLI